MKSNQKIKIIAEIGWNHMGKMNLAKKMIEEAAKAGADYCKFQTWSTKNLVKGPWDNDGRFQIYKKAELTEKNYKFLIKTCKQNKVKFLTSVFNVDDLKNLKKLNFNEIKIPSHEVYNLRLIKEASKLYKTLLISVGACKWKEFLKITKNIKIKNVIFMHCVSSYPLESKNVNFPKFFAMKNKINNIGYSGHLAGIDDALFAISNGAKYIEKHFTINNNLPGRDNKFAILPNDLRKICQFRDSVSLMTTNKGLNIQKCEIDIYKKYRGRWSGKR